MKRKRVAILISGRGSNMRALIEAAAKPDYPAEIVLVLSNIADAGGLAFARERGIATEVIEHKSFPSREIFDNAMNAALERANAEIIALAGFMRLLSPRFVEKWRGRMINIHPSLLPKFKGLHTHKRALEAGEKIHGCTVHFVEPELDSGPIILQAEVPVLADDTEDSLAARVLAEEHRIYPEALRLVVEGKAKI
ncbi:MAG: phosphoribosylglycinamide formyltransferase [Xanthobacteraceae bacterium]|nr:phosphoribosylglycinamide formyltransferase [Xanthobacteraceae bacterium]QYK46011.1 MAG: phosphoribosylglycinamide formyltransferase [Xanthobacteraceae bacterium]